MFACASHSQVLGRFGLFLLLAAAVGCRFESAGMGDGSGGAAHASAHAPSTSFLGSGGAVNSFMSTAPEGCSFDAECPASARRCLEAEHRCVVCLDAADCAVGSTCVEGECTERKTCQSNLDCVNSLWPVCDTSRGLCVRCNENADCPASLVCVDNRCERDLLCGNTLDCPGQLVCLEETARCTECNNDASCAGEHQVCRQGICREICRSDANCSNPTPRCDVPSGACLGCLAHADCRPNEYCNAAGTCVLDRCAEGEGRCVPGGIEMCNLAGDGYVSAVPCSNGVCSADRGHVSCGAAGATALGGSRNAAGTSGCGNTNVPSQLGGAGGALGGGGTPSTGFGGASTSNANGGSANGGNANGGNANGGNANGGNANGGDANGGTISSASSAATSGGSGGVTNGGATSDVTVAGGASPFGGGPGNAGRPAAGGQSGAAGAAGSKCAGEAHPCYSIPRYTASQVVDGNGDDFCQVPAFQFDFSNADGFVEYNEASTHRRDDYPERVTARVAWSPNYVHAFVRVEDPFIEKADSLEYIYGADSIELMISADDHLSGDLTKDSSAMHIIAGPWASSAKGMAASVIGTKTALPDDQYAVTIDDRGYNVELRVPWPNKMTVEADRHMYFDMAINAAIYAIRGQVDVRDAQAVFRLRDSLKADSCGQPYCDDLTWCATKLNGS